MTEAEVKERRYAIVSRMPEPLQKMYQTSALVRSVVDLGAHSGQDYLDVLEVLAVQAVGDLTACQAQLVETIAKLPPEPVTVDGVTYHYVGPEGARLRDELTKERKINTMIVDAMTRAGFSLRLSDDRETITIEEPGSN